MPDAAGEETAPNAIVIEPEGDAHFAAVDGAEFTPADPAKVLPFNRTLVVARFRCNIQEASGVSCLSEQSGKGFSVQRRRLPAPVHRSTPRRAVAPSGRRRLLEVRGAVGVHLHLGPRDVLADHRIGFARRR